MAWTHARYFILSGGCLACSLVPLHGEETVLVTGGGQTIVSATRAFSPGTNISDARLLFDFGFATEEALRPGTFADSFSLTLQPASSLDPILYFTFDVSGPAWAPITPGTFPLSSNSLVRAQISFPSLSPDLPNKLSFRLNAPIPDTVAQQPFTLHFDLFDNGDASRSLAWFNEPVVVPEPSTFALLGLAVLAWFGAKAFRR